MVDSRTINTKIDIFEPVYRGDRLFEPLQITIAIIDKRCPSCGCGVSDDLGLDLGYDNAGKLFGGMCFRCGWTFGFIKSGLFR
jgi:hypothetical protein